MHSAHVGAVSIYPSAYTPRWEVDSLTSVLRSIAGDAAYVDETLHPPSGVGFSVVSQGDLPTDWYPGEHTLTRMMLHALQHYGLEFTLPSHLRITNVWSFLLDFILFKDKNEKDNHLGQIISELYKSCLPTLAEESVFAALQKTASWNVLLLQLTGAVKVVIDDQLDDTLLLQAKTVMSTKVRSRQELLKSLITSWAQLCPAMAHPLWDVVEHAEKLHEALGKKAAEKHKASIHFITFFLEFLLRQLVQATTVTSAPDPSDTLWRMLCLGVLLCTVLKVDCPIWTVTLEDVVERMVYEEHLQTSTKVGLQHWVRFTPSTFLDGDASTIYQTWRRQTGFLLVYEASLDHYWLWLPTQSVDSTPQTPSGRHFLWYFADKAVDIKINQINTDASATDALPCRLREPAMTWHRHATPWCDASVKAKVEAVEPLSWIRLDSLASVRSVPPWCRSLYMNPKRASILDVGFHQGGRVAYGGQFRLVRAGLKTQASSDTTPGREIGQIFHSIKAQLPILGAIIYYKFPLQSILAFTKQSTEDVLCVVGTGAMMPYLPRAEDPRDDVEKYRRVIFLDTGRPQKRAIAFNTESDLEDIHFWMSSIECVKSLDPTRAFLLLTMYRRDPNHLKAQWSDTIVITVLSSNVV